MRGRQRVSPCAASMTNGECWNAADCGRRGKTQSKSLRSPAKLLAGDLSYKGCDSQEWLCHLAAEFAAKKWVSRDAARVYNGRSLRKRGKMKNPRTIVAASILALA